MSNMVIKYNGFYYYYDAIQKYNECIKFFESGIVKRIIYTNEVEDIVNKLFYVENIPYEVGFYTNIPGQLYAQINTMNGQISYYYNNSNLNDLLFTVHYPNGFIQNINYAFYAIQSKEKNQNKKEIEFICVSCKKKFTVSIINDFDAFVCRNCRSVYTYENGSKVQIFPIIKAEYIPLEIRKLLNFFEYDKKEIDKELLKSKYKELLLKYHPDKVSTLGDELKDLAENKTKEIISNYKILEGWLEQYKN